jgi:catechol-2,3-dioxygenase
LDRVHEAGATVIGASDHTVTHSLYVLDPDGNELELYIDVPGVDWRSDPSLVMAPIKPLDLELRPAS